MDYLGEMIALGMDTVIFAICLKHYVYYKNAVKAIKVDELLYYYENFKLHKFKEKCPRRCYI